MRYGNKSYHKIDEKKITQIISTKGITQAKIIKMALSLFIKRKKKSFIIVISALSISKCSIFDDNINTLPYVSVYEGINAFSYFHAKSIYEEIKLNKLYSNIDFLHILPAAVITSNTKKFLKNTLLSVKDDYFVECVIKLLNNYNGTTTGCIEHLLVEYLPSLLPLGIFKKKILYTTGVNIAKLYDKKNN